MIYKSKQTSNYTVVPNNVFEDLKNGLSVGILTYLLSRPRDWVTYKKQLYSHFSEGRISIDKAFKELEEKGYIVGIRSIGEDGRITGYEWVVYDTPILPDRMLEFEQSEADRMLENRLTENQQSEIEQLLSKEILSKEYNKENKKDSDAKASNVVSYKDESIDLDKVLAYINNKFNKSYRVITEKVKKEYLALLKAGYNKFEVKSAIDNVAKSEFAQKANFAWATLKFFAKPEKIDIWATMKAEITAENIEFSLEEKARLCRHYEIKIEYGDTNFIVPPQITDEEKVAYRKFFDHYKDDIGPMHYELNHNVRTVGIVNYVKNKNI
jgi:uncharacterized phage protein (TIGR02220 family)